MLRPIVLTLEMIKFQHTIFALPFAFLAAFVAARGIPPASKILWIVLAMIGARSAAMAFNRLVDINIDRTNPRTAGRALPARQLSIPFVIGFTIVSIALFVYAAFRLNTLAFLLSPLALVVILGYSLTKRFTSLSHIFLGLALAIAPAGAWIAVTGNLDPRVLALAAAVLFWTAGFDTLYSLQDLDFDRKTGLHSLPSALGAPKALLLARLFHLLAVGGFIVFGLLNDLGGLYYAGVAAAIVLLIWQQSLISPADLSRINAAFFTANGALSIVLFVCGACDILTRTPAR